MFDKRPGRSITKALKRISAPVLLLSVMLSPVSATAQSSGEVVRFCFNDWPPYAEADDEGSHGISVDILREAADRADLTAYFEELPWNRCLEMVRQGEFDAVVDALIRPEYLQGPTSFSLYANLFWVQDGSPYQAPEMSEMAGARLGLVAGYDYPPDLLDQAAQLKLTIEYSVDDWANIRQLAFGRVDVIVADFVGTHIYATEQGLAVHPLTPAHSVDSLYPSFNSTKAGMQHAIDGAIRGMLEDGTVDRIYEDHIGVSFSEILGFS